MHSVALTGKTYVSLLRNLVKRSVAGGRVYDAVLGECARKAKAQTILTFNRKHLDPPPTGVTVVEPSF